MYTYENLSMSRQFLIQELIKFLPEVQDTITRRQLQDAQAGIQGFVFPQWLTIPGNSLSRGVYKFPRPSGESTHITTPVTLVPELSDDDILDKIRDIDSTFSELVRSMAHQNLNSLVISGAPGLGKSHDVNQILSDQNGGEWNHTFWRGYIKATGLFRLLYENRQPGQVLVLDDTDAIFSDEVALNILKAALELKKSRTIGWGSEKEFTDQDGEVIPRYFEYQGSIIFLTNLSIRKLIESNSKFATHLAAIESRSLVFDIRIETPREFLMKIKLKLESGLLSDHGLSDQAQNEIFNYMEQNQNRLTELSLRMVEKLGLLYKSNPTGWRKMANHICLKGGK